MDTVITRDSDIIREYMAVLDSHGRGVSPFGRFASSVKLSRLRNELERVHLETSDEDIVALRSEIDHRLSGGISRRFVSGRWGARFAAFLIPLIGWQLVLLAVLGITAAFVAFAPVPGWWNRLLPHDDPAFMALFLFAFFFVLPMLAVLLLFGGRFLQSWRFSVPVTLLLLAASAGATYLVMRGKANPVLRPSSIRQFTRERGLNIDGYQQWINGKWLLQDPKFQSDYERYVRNGPGRWITARIGQTDGAWQNSLGIMSQYLDGGADQNGFRDWLKYYLERNRIYSEERLDQESRALTSDQRYLGIWQVQPYLKERDQRTYQAYLGSISHSMKLWGAIEMAALFVLFVAGYFLAPVIARAIGGRSSGGINPRSTDPGLPPLISHQPFPERDEITTPPFFETPFKVLGRAHRDFLRVTVFSSAFLFLILGAVYASGLSGSQQPGPSSLTTLERRYILFAGKDETPTDEEAFAVAPADISYAGVPSVLALKGSGNDVTNILVRRITELENRLDDEDYDTSKKFGNQGKLIASAETDIQSLRGQSSQMELMLQPLPQQLEDVGSRAASAEQRAGQALGEATTASQKSDTLDQRLTGRIDTVEAKATRASEDAGRVEDETSTLATRTDSLEKELDRRAHQIEAQTLELGKRTSDLKERQDEFGRIERVALTSILSDMTAQVDQLDVQTHSVMFRIFNKKEARQRAAMLDQRIKQLYAGLFMTTSPDTKPFMADLLKLRERVQEINSRIK